MGAILHKVDFIYPYHPHLPQPQQLKQLQIDLHYQQAKPPIKTQQPKQVGPKLKIDENKPTKISKQLAYRSTYDDYSQCSSYMNQSQSRTSSPSNRQNKVGVEKKILLLPASQHGPLLLSVRKSQFGLKVSSYVSGINPESRNPSEISLNSNQSRTILVKKALRPNIQQILTYSPSKGQCYKFMQKSKQAWRIQSYQRCIQYLKQGLQACHNEHPTNYSEKGIYHRRIAANYRMLYQDEQALKHFQESLKYFSMEPQAQIIQIAAVLNNIGIIYQEENHQKEALENFTRSLELKRQFLPQNHQQLAMRLSNIGFLQWSVGQRKKSVDSYAQALHINKIVFGYNHHEVAKNYYDLSLCLFSIEEYGLWLDYHYESLKIMKKLGLTQSVDYKTWMNCFKIRMRQFLASQKHQHDLVVKSLGMMTLILDKDEQISFLTEMKDDLQKIQ